MTLAARYPWPSPAGVQDEPKWIGDRFQIGTRRERVLQYGVSEDGWSDDLSVLHEEFAGSEHPMDRASRSYALWQLGRHVRPQSVILEVGCSSGYLLKELGALFQSALVIGADSIGWLGEVAGRAPGIPLLQFDLTECPLPDATVDAVICLNVLEHIADDLAAMRQIARVLRPGGIAVIEVPAGPTLYDWYDESLRHYRRYSMKGLRDLAGRAGLGIVRATHLGAFVYPGFGVLKRYRRWQQPTARDLSAVKRSVSRTRASRGLAACLAIELAVGRVMQYPFGIRCVATCQKPSSS